MKRVICHAAVILALCAMAFGESGTCGPNATWVLDSSTGILNISGSGSMTYYNKESSVPWYNKRSQIVRIEVSEGITSIGMFAFYGCVNVQSVSLPSTLTSIGGYSMYRMPLVKSLVIPQSVKSIGSYAFCYCHNLTSVFIPANVTSIGAGAFASCTHLESIDVDRTNPVFKSYDGVVFDKEIKTLVLYPSGKGGDYSIPDTVTTIGHFSFSRCRILKSVKIPNSVVSINTCAFFFCTNLTSVAIPDSVVSIGTAAFKGCDNLETATFGKSLGIIVIKLFLTVSG